MNEEPTLTLIERLQKRAIDPKRATDESEDNPQGIANAPATRQQLIEAEIELGFTLPALLRQLYLEIGNGGFGPGAGLPNLADLVAWYQEKRKPSARKPAQKQNLIWPMGLLPICDWGVGIYSCLDGTKPESPVIRLDPNAEQSRVESKIRPEQLFDRASAVPEAAWIEALSFETWLEDWASGRMLFYAAYDVPGDSDEDEDGDEEETETEAAPSS